MFEDSYDIEAMLVSAGLDSTQLKIKQNWNSENAIKEIKSWNPDIVLLDHFMPPTNGLEVLKAINSSVSAGELIRPRLVVGISTAGFANRAMQEAGADHGVKKFKLPEFFPTLISELSQEI